MMNDQDDDFDFTNWSEPSPTGPDAFGRTMAFFRPAVSKYFKPDVARIFFEATGQRESIPAGTTLFVENEKSGKTGLFSKRIVHRMYLLSEGEVELTLGGKRLDVMRAGDLFGEMAVISEIPDKSAHATRTATAKALTDCAGHSMDGEQTLAALRETPEFALMLMSVMFDRLRFLAARLAARNISTANTDNRPDAVFDTTTLKSLEHKLPRANIVRFEQGARIMREGQAGSSMYIVLEGRVSVAINKKIVEKMGVGGVFGEMALVDQSPRSASAVARTDCTLLSFNRDSLIGLVKSDPEIGMAMMRAAAQRVRYMNSLFA
jgi:CRP-like cAMP-binding protein